jgi:starch phosphorylase
VNGWQIGGGYEGSDTDEHDAKALYARLINDVLPCYGTEKWTEMMRRSIDMASERFSAARMVKDYYDKLY